MSLPTLPPLPSTALGSGTGASISGRSGRPEDSAVGGPDSIWTDEEEKSFYEDILDLRGEVPSSLLGVGSDGNVAKDAPTQKAEDLASDAAENPPKDTDTIEEEKIHPDEEALGADEGL